LLAEGGLIVATGPDRVEDVVRGGTDYALGLGLQTVEPYRVGYVATENAEVGHARFNDAHLPAQTRIGLDITLTTRQYNDSATSNQTLLLYRIRNTSAARLTNLYCALFMDWDLGPAGADDYISIDLEHRLGYADNRKNRRLPYTGTMLLSDQPANFYAIDNSTDYPIGKGFMAAEKWDLISGGVGREETKTGDCSMIIGAGPIALEPGADTVVAFSLMAGANIAELNASADAASARFASLGEIPGGPILLPSDFRIAGSIPNPFTRETVIEYWLPMEGEASLDAFDAIGRRVATLASGFQTKGVHTARFTLPDNAASGVYVVRLTASGGVVSRNLIHLAR
ncbi:MAG: T9SS type A sorting domain-containing protein, partial [Bacteroidota bacterium]